MYLERMLHRHTIPRSKLSMALTMGVYDERIAERDVEDESCRNEVNCLEIDKYQGY